MIGLVQRVEKSAVVVKGRVVASIGCGLLVFLGVHCEDTEKDLELLVRKCVGLRIFSDVHGKMNLSITDVKGEILVVSQFTLLGNVKRGLRPYFGDAARPEIANEFYEKFVHLIKKNGIEVKGGIFGAHMHVDITNDGPVTIILDTRYL